MSITSSRIHRVHEVEVDVKDEHDTLGESCFIGRVSLDKTIYQIIKIICFLRNLNESQCRMWIQSESCQPIKNRLTTDVTDNVDGSTLLHDLGQTVSSFGCEKLHLILEMKDHQDKWPRDLYLQKWKLNLHKGDRVDALNCQNCWLEGIIQSVDSKSCSYLIEFRGYPGLVYWERHSFTNVANTIEPLYSKTKNWIESLSTESFVEYYVENGWCLALVTDYSPEDERVRVCYLQDGRILQSPWSYAHNFHMCPLGLHWKYLATHDYYYLADDRSVTITPAELHMNYQAAKKRFVVWDLLYFSQQAFSDSWDQSALQTMWGSKDIIVHIASYC